MDPTDRAPFAVKIRLRAKRNAVTGLVGDALKVALTAPPVDEMRMPPALNSSRNF